MLRKPHLLSDTAAKSSPRTHPSPLPAAPIASATEAMAASARTSPLLFLLPTPSHSSNSPYSHSLEPFEPPHAPSLPTILFCHFIEFPPPLPLWNLGHLLSQNSDPTLHIRHSRWERGVGVLAKAQDGPRPGVGRGDFSWGTMLNLPLKRRLNPRFKRSETATSTAPSEMTSTLEHRCT